MNPDILTRVMTLFILGFFFSCSTPKEYQSIAKHINTKRYADAIKVADELIAKNPANAEVYYYKAFALNEQARSTKKIIDRISIYQNFVRANKVADSLYLKENKKGSRKNVLTQRSEAWAREFNFAAKTALAIRENKPGNWDDVYDSSNNAMILQKDSTQALAYWYESAFESGYFIELDSLLNVYEPQVKDSVWFKKYKMASLLQANKNEEALSFIQKNEDLLLPNTTYAHLLQEYTAPEEIIQRASLVLKKQKPDLAFNQLMAKTWWETIIRNTELDSVDYVLFDSIYVTQPKAFFADSILLDKKAKIVDAILEHISFEENSKVNTEIKATIFSNLATIYSQVESEMDKTGTKRLSEKAVYFFRKAVPEWNILLYQYKQNPIQSSEHLIAIYELLGEDERATELKKEFSF